MQIKLIFTHHVAKQNTVASKVLLMVEVVISLKETCFSSQTHFAHDGSIDLQLMSSHISSSLPCPWTLNPADNGMYNSEISPWIWNKSTGVDLIQVVSTALLIGASGFCIVIVTVSPGDRGPSHWLDSSNSLHEQVTCHTHTHTHMLATQTQPNKLIRPSALHLHPACWMHFFAQTLPLKAPWMFL